MIDSEPTPKKSLSFSQKTPSSRVPPYKYLYCSLSNLLSTWLQYEVLQLVSFPLQVLSKSAKIIASLIMGYFVHKRIYKLHEYVLAVTVMCGLVLFTISEHHHKNIRLKSNKSFHELPFLESSDLDADDETNFELVIGSLMLIGYVLTDAFTSHWQSRIFNTHNITERQMMLGVNVSSFFISMFTIFFDMSSITQFWNFICLHPELLVHILLMSVASTIGQIFIFRTISQFGAVTLASVMTTRQLLAILISVFIFKHQIDAYGVIGLFCVFLALFAKIFMK